MKLTGRTEISTQPTRQEVTNEMSSFKAFHKESKEDFPRELKMDWSISQRQCISGGDKLLFGAVLGVAAWAGGIWGGLAARERELKKEKVIIKTRSKS